MKLGRICVTADNGVMIGDVQSPKVQTLYNADKLCAEVDTYDFVIAAGLMDPLGDRTLIEVLYEYYGDKLADHVISGANIGPRYGKSAVTSGIHLFGKVENGEAEKVWDDDRVNEWIDNPRFYTSQAITRAMVDYLHTRCSDERAQDIMNELKGKFYKAREEIYATMGRELEHAHRTSGRISMRGFRGSETINQFLNLLQMQNSIKTGRFVISGIGVDQGIKLSRYAYNTKFSELADGYFKVVLYGWMNRLRFPTKKNIVDFASDLTGYEHTTESVAKQMHNSRSEFVRKSFSEAKRMNEAIKEDGLFNNEDSINYVMAQVKLIDAIREAIPGSAIIEVSNSTMGFAFKTGTDVDTIVKVLAEKAEEYMPNMFFNMQVYEKPPKLSIDLMDKSTDILVRKENAVKAAKEQAENRKSKRKFTSTDIADAVESAEESENDG